MNIENEIKELNLSNFENHTNSKKMDIEESKENLSEDLDLTKNFNLKEQELKLEIERLKEKWIRTTADLENLHKRLEKEKEELRKFSQFTFAKDILTIHDNLLMALNSCKKNDQISDHIKNTITGIEITERELVLIFERNGIKIIDPIGEKFDPCFHQAMTEIESDEYLPGFVVQVLQLGYKLHDRLLRPALVVVAKSK